MMKDVLAIGAAPRPVTYTYTITNTSPASTELVTIATIGDTLVSNLLATFEAANSGSAIIASGNSVTFSVSETVPVQAAGTTFTNTLNVTVPTVRALRLPPAQRPRSTMSILS